MALSGDSAAMPRRNETLEAQPGGERETFDREAEVGQRDVGLQQGHGTGLDGELCRSA